MNFRNWLIAISVGALSMGAQGQTLETLYRSALQNDTDLKATQANARATDTLVIQGRSELLPRLSLDAESAATYQRGDEGFPGLDEDGDIVYSGEVGLVLSQNLFNMQAFAGYDAVRNQSAQSEAQITAARADLLVRVVDAYLDVLKAREGVTLADRVIETVERQKEQTEERYEVGLVAVTDVLEATAALDQARADRLQADNQLTLSKQQLSRITGVTVDSLPRLDQDFDVTTVDTGDLTEWLARSRRNPSLVAGQLGIRAAEDELRANRADRLPVVRAQARYGYDANYQDDRTTTNFMGESVSADDFQDSGNFSIALVASMSFPLFDGGSRSAGLSRSGFQLEAQEADLEGNIQQIELAVRQGYQQLQADLSRINALQQVLSSRESAAEAIELGYEVGSRNIVEVLDAQQTLLNAQTDLSNARHDFLSNYFQLKEAAGDLSDQDIAWLNGLLVRASE